MDYYILRSIIIDLLDVFKKVIKKLFGCYIIQDFAQKCQSGYFFGPV